MLVEDMSQHSEQGRTGPLRGAAKIEDSAVGANYTALSTEFSFDTAFDTATCFSGQTEQS
jgi:hypothetical protein